MEAVFMNNGGKLTRYEIQGQNTKKLFICTLRFPGTDS
jgi:hypothetical protein